MQASYSLVAVVKGLCTAQKVVCVVYILELARYYNIHYMDKSLRMPERPTSILFVLELLPTKIKARNNLG